MADPGKDKNRNKIKIEHGKLIFRPQQKQLQNNIIIPFPSFITNKTEQKTKGIEHTNPNLQAAQKNGRSR